MRSTRRGWRGKTCYDSSHCSLSFLMCSPWCHSSLSCLVICVTSDEEDCSEGEVDIIWDDDVVEVPSPIGAPSEKGKDAFSLLRWTSTAPTKLRRAHYH
jgi:hypothetical protein